ncbi:scaffold attachment factor B1-like isoform X1 [Rhopilema esculentum]|uniref:scaffold attachment factor B1-like isoform X1 n=1 Tax=Rhopilema esculentum TaxID=499914 RepID=UPI0031D8DC18
MSASSPLVEGKKISDLRVADLRLELEQRGIDTKGLKADLVKRLEKALLDESIGTPEAVTPTSEPQDIDKKTSARKSTPRKRMLKTTEHDDASDAQGEADGSMEEISTDAGHALDYTGENQQTLSESLIVNTNDSVACETEGGDIIDESKGSCENPDNFFQDGMYDEEVEGQEEEGDYEEAEYEGEEGEMDEAYEVVDGDEQFEDAGEEEFEADEEYNESNFQDQEEEYEDEEAVVEEEDTVDEVEQQQEDDVMEDVDGDATGNLEDGQGSDEVAKKFLDEKTEEEEEELERENAEKDDNGELVQDTKEEYQEEEERLVEEERTGDLEEDNTEGDSNNVQVRDEVENEKEGESAIEESEVSQEELVEDRDGLVQKRDEVDDRCEESSQGEAEGASKAEDADVSLNEDEGDSSVNAKEDIKMETVEDSDNVKGNETEKTIIQDKQTNVSGIESEKNNSSESLSDKSKAEETSKDEGTKISGDTKQELKSDKAKEAPAKSPVQPDKDSKKEITKSLWISGLSSVTRAVDLKMTFSAHGKVIGAKVVTSARSPGTHCFGFVTMSSTEEAAKCIEKLDKTEIHGKIVTVERAKHDPTPKKPPPKQEKKPDDKKQPQKVVKAQKQGLTSDKKEPSTENKENKDKKSDEKGRSDSRSKDRRGSDRHRRSGSRSRHRPRSRERQRSKSHDRDKSKDSRKTDESKEKGKSSEPSSDRKVKSLNELKEERQQKIEKERRQREERRRKEREKERQLREERRKAQEARERERRERARKEEERMRRERERQRELEREREMRKKRERERLAQERREKEREREEKERLEKERREREARLERERLEKERAKREREERERIEKERLERERKERERIAYDRLRKEREELEKIKTERERLERERLEFERRYALKRSSSSGRRETGGERVEDGYHPEPKRHALESSKVGHGGRPSDFFGGAHSTRDSRVTDTGTQRKEDRGRPESSGHSDYSSKRDGSRHSSHDAGYSGTSLPKAGRDSSPFSYSTSRTRDRSPISAHTADVRREEVPRRDERRDDVLSRNQRRVVSSRDDRDRSPRKLASDILRDADRGRGSERSGSRGDRPSHRDGEGIQYYDAEEKQRDDSWLENQELRNPPKTLTEILERAGVSGILGSSAFDQQVTMTVNDALSIAAASRIPKQDPPDWRNDRRDQRRDERLDDRLEIRRDDRHDDRREDRDRPTASSRDSRGGRDFYGRESDRLVSGYPDTDDISRRQSVDITVSRRAQELLAQAGLQESRGRAPPSQSGHSRDLPVREVPRDVPIQRGYQQRASELDSRDSYSRGIPRNDVVARQDIPNRSYQPPSVMTHQVVSAGQPHIASRPSSQDNWNRSRNMLPTLNSGTGFQVPISGTIIGSSHIRGPIHSRSVGRPGLQGHGLPHQIRRF